MSIHRYRGDGRRPEGGEADRFPYLAEPDLVEVVNMAIHLGRPLLVKGPPGCGKTTVARAIAHELGLERYYEWYVKSTSRAVDGLYTIDVVRRLQDVQLKETRAQRITPYIRLGELGRALKEPGESVVLIDEIDKADIDFPNDLLRELDRKEFEIPELAGDLTPEEIKDGWRRTYGEGADPIIVITSNDEKELPDAFLRRCIFHWIDFPDPDRLFHIVQINTRGMEIGESLIRNAIARLDALRTIEGVRKKPATSELIDWVRILHAWGVEPEALNERRPLTELPHWKILFKHQQDESLVKRRAKELGAT